MKHFDEQLLRLKQCLGLTKDSEVANALGMSKAALSNRKQAGSFPEEKVVMLKRHLPELDVMYVLTGQRWTAGERVMEDTFFTGAAKLGDHAMASSAIRASRNYIQALRDAADDPQVRELLGILLFCDRQAITQVLALAARLMGPKPLPFALREPAGMELLGAAEPPRDETVLMDEAHVKTAAGPNKMKSAEAMLNKLGTPKSIGITATQKRAVDDRFKLADKKSRKTVKSS